MKKKLRLLKNWKAPDGTEYEKGKILEIDDEALVKELLDGKIAEDIKAVEAVQLKEAQEQKKLGDVIKNVVTQVLEGLGVKENKSSGIQILSSREDAPDGGFNPSEFVKDVIKAAKGDVSEKLIKHEKAAKKRLKAEGLNEDTDSEGGFLLPEEQSNTLLEKSVEEDFFLSKIFRLPMSSNTIKIPTIAETSRVDGSRAGGVQGYWTGEGIQKTKSNPKFGQVQIGLNKLVVLTWTTDELIEDSPISIEPLISRLATSEINFKIKDAVFRGTGAGMPLGIIDAPCTVSVTGAGAADTILSTDVINMKSRLHPASWKNAMWFYNVDCFPQLIQMNIAMTSSDQLVWIPAGGISGKPFDTLFGLPAVPLEVCSTLGDVGDIVLVDMTQYIMGEKAGGVKAATSIHLRFDYDETAFRFVMRTDGQPWWNSALTPFKGTNTQSPFITLAART